jgi:hypothetical protein
MTTHELVELAFFLSCIALKSHSNSQTRRNIRKTKPITVRTYVAEGQDDSSHERGELPEEAGVRGIGAGGEERQAGEARSRQRRGFSGGGAPAASQGSDQQRGRSSDEEPHGDGHGGVRHRGPDAAHTGEAQVDARAQRAVRRRGHLLAAGAAQGHRQHQASDHGNF